MYGVEGVASMRDGWPRVLWWAGWVLLATMLVHVAAMVVTRGAVVGPVSLRKPATFAETSWLLCWSVALALPWLRLGRRRRAFVALTVLAFGIGETSVMAIQAWRGVPSHYNFTTTFDAVLMRGGAGGLAFLLLAGLVVLLTGLRHSSAPPGVVVGVVGGVGVLLVGCLVGFVMISNMSGVFQGSIGSALGSPQRGYLGPSAATVGHQYLLLRPHTAGGDLVLLHAVGVHGMVLLTVPAILLTRTRLSHQQQQRLVVAMTGSLVAGLALLAVHAFEQHPWDQLSTVGLAALLVLALGYAAALARSLRAYAVRRT
jgi:hypothetical protein